MRGSAPAAYNSMGIRGPQGYPSKQSQDMRPHVALLPNSTLQPQHGVTHGLPSGDMVLASRPPSSNLSNGGPSPGVSSQVPSSGINPSAYLGSIGVASSGWTPMVQPRPQRPISLSEHVASKPDDPTFVASGTGVKDSSSPVAGNGFVSSSAFGDNFFAASSQGKHNSLVPTSSTPGLNISSSNVPGTQFPNMPSQSSQSSVSQQPTAGQNQQMQSTLKHSHQIPVQNSSAFPVRAENVPSSQSAQPWPKITQSNVQKYAKVFLEVDTDRDGKIMGEQAHNLFLSWRLPRVCMTF